MAVDFEAPRIPTPYRVIFMGAAIDGWSKATDQERREVVLPRLKQMFLEEWPKKFGAKALCTIDDDLFNVGPPATSDFTWYLIYQLDDLNAVPGMLNSLRMTVDGARMDRYIRIEARVGRPFFLLGGV